ncbi:MAG: hypothetical protein Q7S71_05480 [Candidatus Nitrotoga sp.]|nr:hypothetical protein [Candidatus Nitrotoga sp.]
MRLDDKTRKIIKSEVASQFGDEAIVRLFGSRVDDTQRGGDIDLLIEPGRPLAHRIQADAAWRPDCTSSWGVARSMC